MERSLDFESLLSAVILGPAACGCGVVGICPGEMAFVFLVARTVGLASRVRE